MPEEEKKDRIMKLRVRCKGLLNSLSEALTSNGL